MSARSALRRVLWVALLIALSTPAVVAAAPIDSQSIRAPWGGLRRQLPLARPLGLVAPAAIAASSEEVTLPVQPADYNTVIYGVPARVYQGTFVNDKEFPVEDVFIRVRVYTEPGHKLVDQALLPVDQYIVASGAEGTYSFAFPLDPSVSLEFDGIVAKQSWSVPKPLKATVTTSMVDPQSGERHYLGTVTNESSVTVLTAIKVSARETVDGQFFSTASAQELYQTNIVLGPGKSTSFDLIASRPTGGAVPVLEDIRAEGVYRTALSIKSSTLTPSYGTYFKLYGTLKAQAPSWSVVPSETVWMWGYTPRTQKDIEQRISWSPTSGYSASYRVYYGTYFALYFDGDSNYAPVESNEVFVRPKVSLSRPVTPSTVTRGRRFTAYGYLKPYHSGYTKVQAHRYERGKWVLRKTVSAKNSKYYSYSKYSVSMTVPYAGKWRIRAYAPTDSDHAASYSSPRYITAR